MILEEFAVGKVNYDTGAINKIDELEK